MTRRARRRAAVIGTIVFTAVACSSARETPEARPGASPSAAGPAPDAEGATLVDPKDILLTGPDVPAGMHIDADDTGALQGPDVFRPGRLPRELREAFVSGFRRTFESDRDLRYLTSVAVLFETSASAREALLAARRMRLARRADPVPPHPRLGNEAFGRLLRRGPLESYAYVWRRGTVVLGIVTEGSRGAFGWVDVARLVRRVDERAI